MIPFVQLLQHGSCIPPIIANFEPGLVIIKLFQYDFCTDIRKNSQSEYCIQYIEYIQDSDWMILEYKCKTSKEF
jgi:hypothetical protein